MYLTCCWGFRPGLGWYNHLLSLPIVSYERLTTLARVHDLRFVELDLDGDHVDVVLVLEELCGGLEDPLGVGAAAHAESPYNESAAFKCLLCGFSCTAPLC